MAETAIASGFSELLAESRNVSSAFAKKIEMKDNYKKRQYGPSGPVVRSIERFQDQMRRTHQFLLHHVSFFLETCAFPATSQRDASGVSAGFLCA